MDVASGLKLSELMGSGHNCYVLNNLMGFICEMRGLSYNGHTCERILLPAASGSVWPYCYALVATSSCFYI